MPVGPVVVVVVVVLVGGGPRVRPRVQPLPRATSQDGDADQHDRDARDEVQPRVEAVGDDPLRQQQGHQPEREDADRVRDRDDRAERRRVASRASPPDQVGGHDRLAVARGERVGGAPEECCRERHEDRQHAEVAAADEAREAGVGDAVGCLELAAARQLRNRIVRRGDARGRRRHVERALQEALRIGVQLVRRAVGRRADDDLLPPDAPGVVRVVHGQALAARDGRAAQDHFEPQRVQPAHAGREGERVRDRHERDRAPVERDVQPAADPLGVGAHVDALLARLVRRDLRHVQHVAHVEPIAGDLDPREAVDREVAEGMRARGGGHGQRADCGGQQHQFLHRAYLLATGLHRTEK